MTQHEHYLKTQAVRSRLCIRNSTSWFHFPIKKRISLVLQELSGDYDIAISLQYQSFISCTLYAPFRPEMLTTFILQHPLLYQEGVQNILFSWLRILGWMSNGILSSIIIFFFTTNSIFNQAFRTDGKVVDYEVFGVTMYTSIVWVVNSQMALSINYFTWIQHFFIWGSIAFWYLFLVIDGWLPTKISTTAYMVLVEACSPSPFYWLTILVVLVCTLLPYFFYRAFQVWFHPMIHDIIQWERSTDSEIKNPSELPARIEFKMRHLKASLM